MDDAVLAHRPEILKCRVTKQGVACPGVSGVTLGEDNEVRVHHRYDLDTDLPVADQASPSSRVDPTR